jgi:signal transduction histidine kinase
MEKDDSIERKLGECQIQLEDARGLASDREKLLLANLQELRDVYATLRERDNRIRAFDEVLTRANRLSSLGELAASIAHEIKNPLIAIQGFAKRIGTNSDLDRIREYAGYIEKESERLSNVLVRLLDFSRVSAPEREHFDLNVMVDDTVFFTEHHLTRFRNVDLTVEKARDLPEAYADRTHIQQALLNIIMNAAQAMPEGGPLAISTGQTPDSVWVSVTDSGAGIAQENLDRIFEPFFTTKESTGGTGLGLSLTKKLVEANRGGIEVESTVGKGSTFRIVLPASRR